MKLIQKLLLLLALIYVNGCKTDNIIEIPYDTICLQIEHNNKAPFKVDGISKNLNSDEIISFLTLFYKGKEYDSEMPSIVIETNTKASMPGGFKVLNTIKELSVKYNFTVYYLPLPHGRAPDPLFDIRDTWKKYKKSNYKSSGNGVSAAPEL